MTEDVTPFLKTIRAMKKNVKIFFCDTRFFEEINFEFILLGTPHKSGVIEVIFAKPYYHMHAVTVYKGPHENLNTGLCPKCTTPSTKLENIMVNLHKDNVPTRSSLVKCQTMLDT